MQISCLRSYFTIPSLKFPPSPCHCLVSFNIPALWWLRKYFQQNSFHIATQPMINFAFPRNFNKSRILVRYCFIYHYHFDSFFIITSRRKKIKRSTSSKSLIWMPRYTIRHWKEKSELKRFLYRKQLFPFHLHPNDRFSSTNTLSKRSNLYQHLPFRRKAEEKLFFSRAIIKSENFAFLTRGNSAVKRWQVSSDFRFHFPWNWR